VTTGETGARIGNVVVQKNERDMPTDPINDKALYPSDNAYGIPSLRPSALSHVPAKLVPYRTRLTPTQQAGCAVHFFLFDAIFESVWNCPAKSGRYLHSFECLLTPDFSLNVDMPLAVQVFNVYRNRWCGANWQAQGHTVIPTVGWSTPDSYNFCFLGIPTNSPVALTTLGTRRQKAVFLHGFFALLERLQPSVILCYGKPFAEMEVAPLQVYPSRYDQIKTTSDG
jgi:hypothetical protein